MSKSQLEHLNNACVRTFFPDECVRLVLGVVRISEAAVWSQFELKKLMPEFALVANTINMVKEYSLITSILSRSLLWESALLQLPL